MPKISKNTQNYRFIPTRHHTPNKYHTGLVFLVFGGVLKFNPIKPTIDGAGHNATPVKQPSNKFLDKLNSKVWLGISKRSFHQRTAKEIMTPNMAHTYVPSNYQGILTSSDNHQTQKRTRGTILNCHDCRKNATKCPFILIIYI